MVGNVTRAWMVAAILAALAGLLVPAPACAQPAGPAPAPAAATPSATGAPAAPGAAAAPACDGTATPKILQNCTPNSGDTAWMLTSVALVLMMTIPGLGLFYGGMVRKK